MYCCMVSNKEWTIIEMIGWVGGGGGDLREEKCARQIDLKKNCTG